MSENDINAMNYTPPATDLDAEPLPQPAANAGDADVEEAAEDVESVKDAYESSEYADLIREIGEGKWGVGQDRRRRLQEAGYDHRAIQAEIIRLRNL